MTADLRTRRHRPASRQPGRWHGSPEGHPLPVLLRRRRHQRHCPLHLRYRYRQPALRSGRHRQCSQCSARHPHRCADARQVGYHHRVGAPASFNPAAIGSLAAEARRARLRRSRSCRPPFTSPFAGRPCRALCRARLFAPWPPHHAVRPVRSAEAIGLRPDPPAHRAGGAGCAGARHPHPVAGGAHRPALWPRLRFRARGA